MNVQLHPDFADPNGISAAASRELLDTCPYPIAKVNREWNVGYSNSAARQALFSGENPVGRNYWVYFPHEQHLATSSRNRFQSAMDKETPSELLEFYPTPRDRWMSVSIHPSASGVVLFFKDVTAERQTLDALVNADRLSSLGRLASAIAHEVRNPLEAVTNLVYLAQQSQEMDELKSYLRLADQELGRASSIVGQTLRFTRSSAPALVSCDALVKDVLSLQKTPLQTAKIETDTRSLRPGQVFAKEGEIRQILNNLISNAIDAMSPAGGRLVIRIRKATQHETAGMMITVADTGVGMSQDTLAKSFDAFFTTKSNRGNGLGLWISRELAGRLGGTLKARSNQRPGQCGSVFQLFLPISLTIVGGSGTGGAAGSGLLSAA